MPSYRPTASEIQPVVFGFGDTALNTSQATAPTANAHVCDLSAALLGTTNTAKVFKVTITTQVSAVDVESNMRLFHGSTQVGRLASSPVAFTHFIERLAVASGEAVFVDVAANAGAGIIYRVTMQATPVAEY